MRTSCFTWTLLGGFVALVFSAVLPTPLQAATAAESETYAQASLNVQAVGPMTDERRQQQRSHIRSAAPTPDPVAIPIPSALSAIPLFALAAAVAARWRHRC